MRRTTTRLMPALLLVLAGCSGLLPDTATAPVTDAAAAADRGTLMSSTGCTLHYRRFAGSADNASGDLVVLAHGFLRSQDRMQALAAAIAREGVDVVTLDFCNTRPWNGRHVQNARDMQALARALEARRVVYAGFSAGALSALVAARLDPSAIGVVALDLVDTGDIGVRAADGLDKPVLALAGEPTNCNARDNARAVYAAAGGARVLRIPGAGHCDFEGPTDGLCELLCEAPRASSTPPADPPPSRSAVSSAPEQSTPARAAIIDAATRAVQALLDGESARWPHNGGRVALDAGVSPGDPGHRSPPATPPRQSADHTKAAAQRLSPGTA
ncbi:MAG: alpha/beta hydrolase [Thiohalocapsa sp.]|nr:alpha/beta hydrolase [Thiohalocapsa sp.]